MSIQRVLTAGNPALNSAYQQIYRHGAQALETGKVTLKSIQGQRCRGSFLGVIVGPNLSLPFHHSIQHSQNALVTTGGDFVHVPDPQTLHISAFALDDAAAPKPVTNSKRRFVEENGKSRRSSYESVIRDVAEAIPPFWISFEGAITTPDALILAGYDQGILNRLRVGLGKELSWARLRFADHQGSLCHIAAGRYMDVPTSSDRLLQIAHALSHTVSGIAYVDHLFWMDEHVAYLESYEILRAFPLSGGANRNPFLSIGWRQLFQRLEREEFLDMNIFLAVPEMRQLAETYQNYTVGDIRLTETVWMHTVKVIRILRGLLHHDPETIRRYASHPEEPIDDVIYALGQAKITHLSETARDWLYPMALFHDIGKISNATPGRADKVAYAVRGMDWLPELFSLDQRASYLDSEKRLIGRLIAGTGLLGRVISNKEESGVPADEMWESFVQSMRDKARELGFTEAEIREIFKILILFDAAELIQSDVYGHNLLDKVEHRLMWTSGLYS